ncbi:transporter substrate-binding domain-containing protein [Aeromonas jandaei]|uniref:Transporter substrate-binding domain-containing protein n=2 Tax=Aeromonas jandaei TaxID=650 RepID=A0ABX6ZJW4_AERJA|nr:MULTISPECIES: transporter substrate-binding domain-containing protein [Aeromonas]MBL0596860.1 transporter substrate-binding domain-containing protein [Aeromonas jandaei]MCF7719148.1 transporter substrate-binding domain-containing protein [Aeromonas jandaei]QNF18010.1 transporter substrate-binding domain-containing protein [Aeromonas jandaei]QQB19622.1 transporter substrate-binding domain-containing protein [Aeromonas jandaei]QWL66340.1 transporter substrate-binding domain-containing protein
MKPWIGLAALLVSSFAHASPELAKLHYLTEDYKPYNYADEAGNPTGFAVELLKLVWQKTNTPEQPVTIMPWARGYYLLTQKPNAVLFSTARTQARDPLFKWACPIGYAEIVLVGLAEHKINITKLDDAKAFNIGAVRADVGEQLLLNNGFDETKIIAANRLSQALKMLTSGRVDMVSTNKTTMEQQIQEQKLDPAKFKEQWQLSSEQFCYAFSHPVSDDLVKEFQNGLTQVLAGSEYPLLHNKYFPAPAAK